MIFAQGVVSEKDAISVAIALASNQRNNSIVETVKKGLKKSGGYCPCRREKTEDTKCMCKEFRQQVADPNFEGYCHCMLYYKTLKD